MAAIFAFPNARPTESAPHEGAPRPRLTVIEGGRSPRAVAKRRMYRQRRIFAAVVAVVVLWAAVSLVGALVGAVAGSPAGASGTPGAPAAAATHVVRPGDTLWSIAKGLGVGGDIRDVVDALVEENGDVLVPGQVVVIPSELAR